jgi:hypothetical protein
MTHAKEIFEAVKNLLKRKDAFSRKDVRDELRLDEIVWKASYGPIFQGMRIDQPGGAPTVPKEFRNVFERVEHGKYKLIV